MNAAKIQLSKEEMALVQNSQWLLTKNEIIEKAGVLFGCLAQQARAFINTNKVPLPSEVLQLSPKISKGNHYQGLPYLVLDYPRYFGKEDIFAIRCFFWWGNYFSVTLHLKGKYKDMYSGAILSNLTLLEMNGFYFDNGDDEWRQDAAEANCVSVISNNRQFHAQWMEEKVFCKVTARVELQKWNEADVLLFRLYLVVLAALGFQLPSR